MADQPGDPKQPDVDGAAGGAAGASEGDEPQEKPTAQVSAGDPGDAAIGAAPSTSAPEEEGQESLSQADLDALLSAAGISSPAIDETPASQATHSTRPQAAESTASRVAESVGADESARTGEGDQAGSLNRGSLKPVRMPDFSDEQAVNAGRDISVLHDVNLKVHIELGRTRMYIEDVLKLTEGSVVELDNLAGDPVDVYVNGRLVARGEVLVLSDNFCIRVSEIVAGPQRVSVA